MRCSGGRVRYSCKGRTDAGARCIYRYDSDLQLYGNDHAHCTGEYSGRERGHGFITVSYEVSSWRDFGVIFIAVTLFLFSFSTFLGILFYARSNVAYLFGDNWISQTMYKVLALIMLFVGGIAAYTFVWDLGDVGIGLMTIFNTGILYLMGGQAIKELRVFEESNKAQSNSQCSQQGDNVTQ